MMRSTTWMVFPWTLMFAAVVIPGCSTMDRLINQTVTTTVTVVDVASNDLGQVMVFALDEENNRNVFVKNFYSSLKSRSAIREEQNRCRIGLLKYRNRKVKMTWYRDEIGDLVMVAINP